MACGNILSRMPKRKQLSYRKSWTVKEKVRNWKHGTGGIMQKRLRQEKYDLNEDAIKPYFSQEDVHNGLCTVVNKLYGITLTPCDSISVYNKDVKTYIVRMQTIHCWACSIATTCLVPANGAVPG